MGLNWSLALLVLTSRRVAAEMTDPLTENLVALT